MYVPDTPCLRASRFPFASTMKSQPSIKAELYSIMERVMWNSRLQQRNLHHHKSWRALRWARKWV